MSKLSRYVCDECGQWASLSATTSVRQPNSAGFDPNADTWLVTGDDDIEIDWCDNCGKKPRCTLKTVETEQ